ncbi:MAG: hypothetical protein QY314_01765 [Candidatus Dojkabacteria bacterium]|nr:MAG: hypothetical protein QY314_01765 [Candidatus Dojkabacteria bacterium]
MKILLEIMKQKKDFSLRLILAFLFACVCIFIFSQSKPTSAATFSEFSIRSSRIEVSQADVQILVRFTPDSIATEDELRITYAPGFVVDPTPGNHSDYPYGAGDWDGIECNSTLGLGTPSVSGQELTYTVPDLSDGQYYCFLITGGIDTPSSPGNYPITVETRESGVTIDYAVLSVPIVDNDEITMTAAVGEFVRCDVTTAGNDNSLNLGTLQYGTITQSGSGFFSGERLYVQGGTNAPEGMSWYYRSDAPYNGLHSATANYTLEGASTASNMSATTISCGPTTPCYGIVFSGMFGFDMGAPNIDIDFGGATHIGPMTTNIFGERIAYTNGPAAGLEIHFWVLATAAEDTPAANDYTDTLIFTCKADL